MIWAGTATLYVKSLLHFTAFAGRKMCSTPGWRRRRNVTQNPLRGLWNKLKRQGPLGWKYFVISQSQMTMTLLPDMICWSIPERSSVRWLTSGMVRTFTCDALFFDFFVPWMYSYFFIPWNALLFRCSMTLPRIMELLRLSWREIVLALFIRVPYFFPRLSSLFRLVLIRASPPLSFLNQPNWRW